MAGVQVSIVEKNRFAFEFEVLNAGYWQNFCHQGWSSACTQVSFCLVPTLFEIDECGNHSHPTVRYLQLNTWTFQHFMDYVEIGLEGLVVIMTVFYLLQELVEIALRRTKYLASFWNLLELVVIILLGVTSYLKVKDTLKMQDLLADPISITSPKLQNLAFWVGQENNLLGVVTLLLW
jgi:hypothetical protein